MKKTLFASIIVIIIIAAIHYVAITYDQEWLKEMLTTVTALIVGLFAFLLYRNQKADNKKDVARIIELEIQNAEKVLKLAQRYLEKSIPELPNDVVLLQTESWEKNKYLFVGDFHTEQWEAISDFYRTCALFDEAVKTNASYFQKNEEQIRVNIQKRSAELVESYQIKIDKVTKQQIKDSLTSELITKIRESTNLYLATVSEYKPVKPINDAKLCMELIKLNLSLPSAITKLKTLVK